MKWALRSQQLASQAIEASCLVEEIVPIEVPQCRGEPLVIDTDEVLHAQKQPAV